MAKELERQVNVKFHPKVYDKAEEISERLNLTVSEIIRRSVIEGLKSFEGVHLPGSPEIESTEARQG